MVVGSMHAHERIDKQITGIHQFGIVTGDDKNATGLSKVAIKIMIIKSVFF